MLKASGEEAANAAYLRMHAALSVFLKLEKTTQYSLQ
jgi:hypothetical protein